jgi:CPA2 family monovalent cation:H+ antiporter-2
MVVGQSEFSYRAASEALPMRDAFAVLFFVSVGMLFDPAHLIREPVLTVITTVIVLVAKPVAAFGIVIALGYGVRIALRVAVALAQIGEFSYIVASLGDQLRILPPGATDSIVAASIVSITLNPLLYKWIPSMEKALMGSDWLRRFVEPRAVRELQRETVSNAEVPPHRAIVVGYGPVGQTVSRLLKQHDIQPTIIELNIETVQRLKKEQTPAVYGDAGHPDILKEAGVLSATALILSAHGSPESTEIVKAARQLNPGIQVLVRSAFLSETGAMRRAGADEVFSAEAEVAMAMTEFMLRNLGATPDQIESEGTRARKALYEGDSSA